MQVTRQSAQPTQTYLAVQVRHALASTTLRHERRDIWVSKFRRYQLMVLFQAADFDNYSYIPPLNNVICMGVYSFGTASCI